MGKSVRKSGVGGIGDGDGVFVVCGDVGVWSGSGSGSGRVYASACVSVRGYA